MISTRQKEKTFHAITYFLTHTENCYKKKLYKLLFLLDFDAFEDSGRGVTHYDYFAWKMGPVPTELHEAIENHDGDLYSRFKITSERLSEDIEALRFETEVPFEPRYFSDRELEILERLSETWKYSTANELEYFTHRPGSPWDKVWNQEKKPQQVIPFEYALDYMKEGDREIILNIADERAAVLANYK
jgi:uncharacterized phage-associated protein